MTEIDPGPVPGEQPTDAELDVTLPPPDAQEPPGGAPHGRMAQDDPSWNPEDS